MGVLFLIVERFLSIKTNRPGRATTLFCSSVVVLKMRFTLSIAVAALASSASAFPSIALEAAAKRAESQKRCPYADMHQNDKRVLGVAPGFDAAAQRIDVSGEHAFVQPDFAAGDQRGPCPGLNALANHNYLPHNGWASLTQFVDATNKGMFYPAVRLVTSFTAKR